MSGDLPLVRPQQLLQLIRTKGARQKVALAYRNTKLTGSLRSGVGGFIASLSYCAYLIHVGMIDLYLHGLKYFKFSDTVALGYVGSVLVRLVVIGMATIGVAMVSRKYLEGPFLKLKRYY